MIYISDPSEKINTFIKNKVKKSISNPWKKILTKLTYFN